MFIENDVVTWFCEYEIRSTKMAFFHWMFRISPWIFAQILVKGERRRKGRYNVTGDAYLSISLCVRFSRTLVRCEATTDIDSTNIMIQICMVWILFLLVRLHKCTSALRNIWGIIKSFLKNWKSSFPVMHLHGRTQSACSPVLNLKSYDVWYLITCVSRSIRSTVKCNLY